MRTLRAGVFLPPCHPNDEGPPLCIERDFQLMQCQEGRGLQRHLAAEQGRSNQEAAK